MFTFFKKIMAAKKKIITEETLTDSTEIEVDTEVTETEPIDTTIPFEVIPRAGGGTDTVYL